VGKVIDFKKQTEKAYQIRLTLLGSEPTVYRVVQVKGDILLSQLHCVIQKLFNWDNEHLYEFEFRKKRYGLSYDDDNFFEEKIKLSAEKFSLIDLKVRKNSKLYYVYDFGDNWEIEVKIEKLLYLPMSEIKTPKFKEWKNIAPPEDFGGIYFFNSIVNEILKNKDKCLKDNKEMDWMIKELIEKIEYVKSSSFFDDMQQKLQEYETNCNSSFMLDWTESDSYDSDEYDSDDYDYLDSENMIEGDFDDLKLKVETLAHLIYRHNPWEIFKPTDLFGVKIPGIESDILFFSFLKTEDNSLGIRVMEGKRGMKVHLMVERGENLPWFENLFTEGLVINFVPLKKCKKMLSKDEYEVLAQNGFDMYPFLLKTKRGEVPSQIELYSEWHIIQLSLVTAQICINSILQNDFPHPLDWKKIPIFNIYSHKNKESITYMQEPKKLPPLDIPLPKVSFDKELLNNSLDLTNVSISSMDEWAIGYSFMETPVRVSKQENEYFCVCFLVMDIVRDKIIYHKVVNSEYELFDNLVEFVFDAISENKVLPSVLLCQNQLIAKYLKQYAKKLKIKLKTEEPLLLKSALDTVTEGKS